MEYIKIINDIPMVRLENCRSHVFFDFPVEDIVKIEEDIVVNNSNRKYWKLTDKDLFTYYTDCEEQVEEIKQYTGLDVTKNKNVIRHSWDPCVSCTKPIPDQEIKADAGKVPLSLVPPEVIWAIGVIRDYGNRKYGDSESWKDVELPRYEDAGYRHWVKFIDEPLGLDDESGLPHLWHHACNVAFLCAKTMPDLISILKEKGIDIKM